MLWKILLGTNLAAVGLALFLNSQKAGLETEVQNLSKANRALSASLATQRELAAAAQEAAAVLRVQREQAQDRADRANAIREAILEGDNDVLDEVDGSLGDALGVLRSAGGGCGGGAGVPVD